MLSGIGTSTVSTLLGLKAPLAGPTFSGTANFVTVSASGAITASNFGVATQAEVNMLQGIGGSTVISQLNAKAPLANAALTGTTTCQTLNPSGVVTLSAGTASTTTNSGALVVGGGIGVSGSIYAGGNMNAVAFYASSDYRIKANVTQLTDSYTVDQMNPVTFDFTNMTDHPKSVGFIAHEMQALYPELVTGEKDGDATQSINYIGIIGILVADVKRMKAQINALTNRLDSVRL
jgi:hypothetical protein